MLDWAAHPDGKLIAANPAKGVKLLKGSKRERFLSEAELARLADTLTVREGEHRLSRTATAAIRLLLLSGCRKAEILSLRWDWVDIERGVLRLPDSKTGAKVVPLAAAAVKLLAELPRSGDHVVPAATDVAARRACRKIGNGCGRAPGSAECVSTICGTASRRSPSPTATVIT
jgi:integrase